jgi:hypothetical protein
VSPLGAALRSIEEEYYSAFCRHRPSREVGHGAQALRDSRRRRRRLCSDEATWPTGKQPQLAEPLLTAYLNDLRMAGMEE